MFVASTNIMGKKVKYSKPFPPLQIYTKLISEVSLLNPSAPCKRVSRMFCSSRVLTRMKKVWCVMTSCYKRNPMMSRRWPCYRWPLQSMKEGNSADMVWSMLASSLHHCKEEFCLENSALVVAGSDASENLLMIGMDFLRTQISIRIG